LGKEGIIEGTTRPVTVNGSGVWQVGAASIHSTVATARPGPVESKYCAGR